MSTFNIPESQFRAREEQLRGMADMRANVISANLPPMPEPPTISNAVTELGTSIAEVERELELLTQSLGPVLLLQEDCKASNVPTVLKGASPIHEMLTGFTQRLRRIAQEVMDTRRRVDL